MKLLPLIPPLLILALTPGCLAYTHEHDAITGTEHTRFRAFMVRGNASKIRAQTKDGDYGRTVSVGAIEGETETDKVAALVATAIAAGVKAAK